MSSELGGTASGWSSSGRGSRWGRGVRLGSTMPLGRDMARGGEQGGGEVRLRGGRIDDVDGWRMGDGG